MFTKNIDGVDSNNTLSEFFDTERDLGFSLLWIEMIIIDFAESL